MTDLTVERLARIELQRRRDDAYRSALVRAAPRQGARRFARLLRSLADRCDGRQVDVMGPWPENRRASGRVRFGATTTTMNDTTMNEWRA